MVDPSADAAAPVTVATDAGMLALWDPLAFSAVVDYDTWERELLEDDDQLRSIRAGSLVPVNIRSDGAFGVLARVGQAPGEARLTQRESVCALVSSQPYRFLSQGTACISGIEEVRGEPWPGTLQFAVPTGEYAVVVHLIDWAAESGGTLDGRAPVNALPDFVVLLNPVSDSSGFFRVKIETFERGE